MPTAPPELLDGVPIFSGLHPREREQIAESMKGRSLEPGETIAVEGEESMVKAAVGSKRKEWMSIIGYSAAVILAFVSPYLAVAIYTLVTARWLIPDRRFEFWH